MSHLVKAILIIVIAVVVLAASGILYTRSHWWVRVGTAELQPSSPQSHVTVYKSSDGNFLFEVEEDSLLSIYVFYPESSKVGIPNFNQFVFLPGIAYSKDVPVPVVYSDNRVKVETDLNISVENKILQFTHRQRRIIADLKSY